MKNIILLDAVNRLLAGVKRLPLATLDDTGDNLEATLALTILNQTRLEVLSRGYANNKRIMTLVPDASGNIHIPEAVIELADWDYPHVLVISDNGMLEDIERGTNVFTSPIKVMTVVDIEFKDLPFVIQDYIMHASRKAFMVELRGKDISTIVFKNLDDSVKAAKARLESWSLRQQRLKLTDDRLSSVFQDKNIRRV